MNPNHSIRKRKNKLKDSNFLNRKAEILSVSQQSEKSKSIEKEKVPNNINIKIAAEFKEISSRNNKEIRSTISHEK